MLPNQDIIAQQKTELVSKTRPFTTEDNTFVFLLYTTTRAQEMSMVDWPPSEKEAFLQMQFNAQQSHYQSTFPEANHEIILLDDQPIGRIYVDRSPHEIRLLDIIIDPEYRNRGLGTQYVQQLQEEATLNKVPVRFYVWQLNDAAQRLYRRLGFDQVDEVGAYILMAWQPK